MLKRSVILNAQVNLNTQKCIIEQTLYFTYLYVLWNRLDYDNNTWVILDNLGGDLCDQRFAGRC